MYAPETALRVSPTAGLTGRAHCAACEKLELRAENGGRRRTAVPMSTAARERRGDAMAWRLRPMDGRGAAIELTEGVVVLGRDPGACDVTLPVPAVSKRHCRLNVSPEALVVEDLDSANGTWANDRRVQTRRLLPGDTLRVASVAFVVERADGRGAGTRSDRQQADAEQDVEIVTEEDGAVVGAGRAAVRLGDTQEFRDSASTVRLAEPPPADWPRDGESFSNVELLSDSQIEDGEHGAARFGADEESASNVVLLSDEEAEDSRSSVRLLSDSQLKLELQETRHLFADPQRVVDDADVVEGDDEGHDSGPGRSGTEKGGQNAGAVPAAGGKAAPAAHTAPRSEASAASGLKDPRSGRPVGLEALADSRTLDAVAAARRDFLRRGIDAMRSETFAVWEHGQEAGPISYDELQARAADGRLFRGAYVRVQRTGQWVSSDRIVGLFPEVDERWLERHRRHWDPRHRPEGGDAGETGESQDATDDPLRPFDAPEADGRGAAPGNARGRVDEALLSIEQMRRRGEVWYDADLWGDEKPDRRPGLLGDWLRRHLLKLAGAFVVVTLGLYLLMPAGDADLLQELEAVHGEMVQLRESRAGARDWKAFKFHVQQRMRPIREFLAATADDEHPARQHMLQAVRDYLPLMLDDARGRPSDAERWYLFHLEQARRTLQGLPTLEKPPGLQPIIRQPPRPVGAAGEQEVLPLREKVER
ncbi:MAG: FHA domain-containing protein [Planctomycetota bacterium]|nr:MAG: FHA domain-containing protein [Planctomycetota bacterium]